MTGLLKRRAFGLPRWQTSFPSALGNDLVPPRHMKSVPESNIFGPARNELLLFENNYSNIADDFFYIIEILVI